MDLPYSLVEGGINAFTSNFSQGRMDFHHAYSLRVDPPYLLAEGGIRAFISDFLRGNGLSCNYNIQHIQIAYKILIAICNRSQTKEQEKLLYHCYLTRL